MNLKKHYDTLYTDSILKIQKDNYILDDKIYATSDLRRGITLIIRPSQEVKKNIQLFLDEIKTIEPDQYFYPNSDIHITVLSIISCDPNFNLQTIYIPDYIKIIEKSFQRMEDIKINLEGITASPAALMIQGFPNSETLNLARASLRTNFSNSKLLQSIDQRYSIATTHSTVMRFQNKIKNKELLLKTFEKYRDFNFGKFKPKNIELVYNDWYHKQVKRLHLFEIG